MKHWLVEIRLKVWCKDLSKCGRVVTYEEVLTNAQADQYDARHMGFAQFERRCKYEPVLRRTMSVEGLSITDCCAADAVELGTL